MSQKNGKYAKILQKVDKFLSKIEAADEYVYVLRLNCDNWYVGYTKNIKKRIRNHFGPQGGCYWTSFYRPITISALFVGDKLVERQVTLEMMKLFGISNVRGYNWCQYKLSERDRWAIQCHHTETSMKYIENCNNILAKVPLCKV